MLFNQPVKEDFHFPAKYYPPIVENQMEKKMENEMETGIIGFIGGNIISSFS